MIQIIMQRNKGETWRDAAKRIAQAYGLEQEVLKEYDAAIEVGVTPAEAAYMACYEWDVLAVRESA